MLRWVLSGQIFLLDEECMDYDHASMLEGHFLSAGEYH